MQRLFFGTMGILFFLPLICVGQNHVPVPVSETEMRDRSSIRIRSMELERVKREAGKPSFDSTSKESEIKFGLIKEDFENIQKLQNQIVSAYSNQKDVDFQKIVVSALEINKRSARLEVNLFGSKLENDSKTNSHTSPSFLRDSIIELDNVVGSFVNGPIFQNTKLVDTKASEESHIDLVKIMVLSESVAKQASALR